MNKFSRLLLALIVIALSIGGARAQIPGAENPIVWDAKAETVDGRAGEYARILVTTRPESGWHVYDMVKREFILSTKITANGVGIEKITKAIEPPAQVKIDPNFKTEVGFHEGPTTFALVVQLRKGLKPGNQPVNVEVTFQACNDSTCLPPNTVKMKVMVPVKAGAARVDRLKPNIAVPLQPSEHVAPAKKDGKKGAGAGTTATGEPTDKIKAAIEGAREQGIIPFLLVAIGWGFLALLTPCVFPMIPITVSFFAKRGDNSTSNVKGALAYCLGMIGTYTGLGIVVTAAFGATGVQNLAANTYVNIALFVIFVALALSLFGAFELALPSGWANKLSSKSGTQGFVGPLLMGLTFTLTSFTCTVPFVGTLLASASTKGWLYPIVGMLGFSTAFALPFFLLALFPQYLKAMPKSGGWLVTVKAFLGFVELLAAFKFLSNVDLVYNWGFLTRPVFLALWAGVAAVAGLYLMGWMIFSHEFEKPKVGWIRRGFGILSFVGAFVFLSAIRGNPLGQIDSFMPPDPYPGQKSSAAESINWVKDFNQAKSEATASGKPIFVNFTGVTCTNCRFMEKNVFPRPDILAAMEGMVPAELYTDRPTDADRANQTIQKQLTGVVSLPVYAVLSSEGEVIQIQQGSTNNPADFLKFLTEARKKAGLGSP